jgi:Zinc-binding dehydrogenase
MKAIRTHQPSGISGLVFEEVPDAKPMFCEVLVKRGRVDGGPAGPLGRDDIRTVAFIQESSRAQLTELARLVDEGHLHPQVGAVYPLAQAARAFSAKAAGGIPGRIILQP